MIFDGHDDIWSHVAKKRFFNQETDIFRRYHYENFKKGNVTASFFVVYLSKHKGYTFEEIHDFTVKAMLEEIEDAKDLINIIKQPEDFLFGKTDKVDVIVSFEGLNQIGEDIDLIDKYYEEYFLRAAGLTWNEQNPLAMPAYIGQDAGLSELGKLVVKRMEKLGTVLDVSHLNDKSFFDVASTATKPFIASHSNARALCNQKRNLTDEQIKEVAKSGGVVGMNSYFKFVSDESKQRKITVDDLVDHVDHIANLVGTDFIACGFDFMHYFATDRWEDFDQDSDDAALHGLGYEGEASLFLLALKKRGFCDEDVEKIGYKNMHRLVSGIIKQ